LSYAQPDMPILSLKAVERSIESICNIPVLWLIFHDPSHMRILMISTVKTY